VWSSRVAPDAGERRSIVRQRDEPKSAALRITNQFHSGGGMAYDLKLEAMRLTLLITARSNADDEGDWRIRGCGWLTADHKVTLVAWGATREEAVRTLGRTWGSSPDTPGLRTLDWDAVVAALHGVRAL
jgi:hypothetical protein